MSLIGSNIVTSTNIWYIRDIVNGNMKGMYGMYSFKQIFGTLHMREILTVVLDLCFNCLVFNGIASFLKVCGGLEKGRLFVLLL